jgi:hypothetical protein
MTTTLAYDSTDAPTAADAEARGGAQVFYLAGAQYTPTLAAAYRDAGVQMLPVAELAPGAVTNPAQAASSAAAQAARYGFTSGVLVISPNVADPGDTAACLGVKGTCEALEAAGYLPVVSGDPALLRQLAAGAGMGAGSALVLEWPDEAPSDPDPHQVPGVDGVGFPVFTGTRAWSFKEGELVVDTGMLAAVGTPPADHATATVENSEAHAAAVVAADVAQQAAKPAPAPVAGPVDVAALNARMDALEARLEELENGPATEDDVMVTPVARLFGDATTAEGPDDGEKTPGDTELDNNPPTPDAASE